MNFYISDGKGAELLEYRWLQLEDDSGSQPITVKLFSTSQPEAHRRLHPREAAFVINHSWSGLLVLIRCLCSVCGRLHPTEADPVGSKQFLSDQHHFHAGLLHR